MYIDDLARLHHMLEAASRVTKDRQAELAQIPWAQIISMRNRVVHAYFDINLEIVWSTITQDLPPLIAELETIMGSEDENTECN